MPSPPLPPLPSPAPHPSPLRAPLPPAGRAPERRRRRGVSGARRRAGPSPRRRGHGRERQAEAGGEAPEAAAGDEQPPAQPQVLRLRPARPHLHRHDGGQLRVHLLLRHPVSAGGGGLSGRSLSRSRPGCRGVTSAPARPGRGSGAAVTWAERSARRFSRDGPSCAEPRRTAAGEGLPGGGGREALREPLAESPPRGQRLGGS